MPARAEFAQEYGVVHGGILAALADTAAVYLTLPHLTDAEGMTSIDFKGNFLEGARPGAGDLAPSRVWSVAASASSSANRPSFKTSAIPGRAVYALTICEMTPGIILRNT
jgi:uncharacterized protein (TIGR00369 family)